MKIIVNSDQIESDQIGSNSVLNQNRSDQIEFRSDQIVLNSNSDQIRLVLN